MYLDDITITYIQSCVADSSKVRFKAKFSRDIGEIFPYINGALKDVIYNKNIPSLTLRKEFRIITLYRDKLAVAKAVNETDAYEIIDYIKDIINETHEKKDQIEPLDEMRSKPTAIEIYSYLPKLNCRRCGEVTCIAFASKLLSGQQNAKKCLPLYEGNYKEKLEVIEDFVQMMGYSS
ncbi:(Fe-S)-binding protein [Clostridium formicaceticum]|uniref:Corrinoid/iron-sulfur protein large subunit n=1 Tax=Clostridium formicaceticum TaxID=1497 RepID=A0AAC9RJL1_9CLOT|nr:(Fe-S)-binding protein [Clostridium formicaceticum]AOY76420.1 Fe-S cluster protein [Clostridium formicaceticum]ARE86814.1 Corrinoid/iron-sulfur protein large subunit [Clostridium formicaceticum]